MSNETNTKGKTLPPNIIQYDHESPSPHFTTQQIDDIESIQKYFSAGDLNTIRKLKWFRRNLNVSEMGEIAIAGLRNKPGSDSAYVRRYSAKKYSDLMNNFLRYVPDAFPKSEVGKCIMYGYRITVPNEDRYHPVSFHRTVNLWHKRLLDTADFFKRRLDPSTVANFCCQMEKVLILVISTSNGSNPYLIRKIGDQYQPLY